MDKIKNVESTGKLQVVDTRDLEIDNREFFGEGLVDCYVVHPSLFKDARGYFENSYDSGQEKTIDNIINGNDLYENVSEDEKKMQELLGLVIKENTSKSSKGTVRGMHYQKEPRCQCKLVRVTTGKAIDVVVDVREDSETFGKWFGVLLTPENHRQLLVPKGYAHGFLALEDDTTFEYQVDEGYHKELEDGIPYDDAGVNIDWDIMFKQYGITDVLTSEKDKLHSTLAEKVANKELTFTKKSSRDTNMSRLSNSFNEKNETIRLLTEELKESKKLYNTYRNILEEEKAALKASNDSLMSENDSLMSENESLKNENEELKRQLKMKGVHGLITQEQIEKLTATYNFIKDSSNKMLLEASALDDVISSFSSAPRKLIYTNPDLNVNNIGEC